MMNDLSVQARAVMEELLEKANLKLCLMEDPNLRAYCKELLDNILV